MCKFKSAIIMKDRIFIPDYDSHSDMLEELGIKDTRANAEKLFVRAELFPKNDDVFSDIGTWDFKVDQDIRPDWFVENYEKERMINAVKEWAKNRIHIGVNGLKIDSGSNHYIKDCKDVEVCGNGTVKYVYGNGTVNKVYGNGTVNKVYGNGTVNEVYGNGTVKYVYGNGTVNKVCGNGTVISSPYTKWENAESLIISDNATFKDNYTKTIYQSGDYKLISVKSGSKIADHPTEKGGVE